MQLDFDYVERNYYSMLKNLPN